MKPIRTFGCLFALYVASLSAIAEEYKALISTDILEAVEGIWATNIAIENAGVSFDQFCSETAPANSIEVTDGRIFLTGHFVDGRDSRVEILLPDDPNQPFVNIRMREDSNTPMSSIARLKMPDRDTQQITFYRENMTPYFTVISKRCPTLPHIG